jgi:hypothetical protein
VTRFLGLCIRWCAAHFYAFLSIILLIASLILGFVTDAQTLGSNFNVMSVIFTAMFYFIIGYFFIAVIWALDGP